MTPDLLIVGAGPAGISAALKARALDLQVSLLDCGETPGGQLFDIHFHPHDVPGFEAGAGADLAAACARQLADAGVACRRGRATSLRAGAAEARRVLLEDGEALEAPAVLIATGLRRRRLDVQGEREFAGRGVTFSATRDRPRLAGRHVAVVGAGDAAFENALLLAATGSEVELCVRGVPRARSEFRERAAAEPRIRVHAGVRVTGITGDEVVRAIQLEQSGERRELAIEAVVVKIGWRPNSEWCRGEDGIALDEAGYVQVDERLATSGARVWAAGDITRPTPPSIAMALGQGAEAAARIRAVLKA